jgi:hypothetical protein
MTDSKTVPVLVQPIMTPTRPMEETGEHSGTQTPATNAGQTTRIDARHAKNEANRRRRLMDKYPIGSSSPPLGPKEKKEIETVDIPPVPLLSLDYIEHNQNLRQCNANKGPQSPTSSQYSSDSGSGYSSSVLDYYTNGEASDLTGVAETSVMQRALEKNLYDSLIFESNDGFVSYESDDEKSPVRKKFGFSAIPVKQIKKIFTANQDDWSKQAGPSVSAASNAQTGFSARLKFPVPFAQRLPKVSGANGLNDFCKTIFKKGVDVNALLDLMAAIEGKKDEATSEIWSQTTGTAVAEGKRDARTIEESVNGIFDVGNQLTNAFKKNYPRWGTSEARLNAEVFINKLVELSHDNKVRQSYDGYDILAKELHFWSVAQNALLNDGMPREEIVASRENFLAMQRRQEKVSGRHGPSMRRFQKPTGGAQVTVH